MKTYPVLRISSSGKQIVFYGLLLGLLAALMRLVEYRFLFIEHSVEIYGGIIALLFTSLGIWLGLKLTKKKEIVVIKEIKINTGKEFVLNTKNLQEFEITPREYEILIQIAGGLSNKEIADKLFVSENTVKTHSSRLFEKLNAKRRTQAVQFAKDSGLIP